MDFTLFSTGFGSYLIDASTTLKFWVVEMHFSQRTPLLVLDLQLVFYFFTKKCNLLAVHSNYCNLLPYVPTLIIFRYSLISWKVFCRDMNPP